MSQKKKRNTGISPRVRRSAPPPLWELDDYEFQDLCRELYCEEKGIASCDVYGERGQRQDGIDLLAKRVDRHHDVGQCKCYRSITARKVEAASDEFIAYWPRWQSERIRRFVLFAACELSKKQLQDQILAEEKKFKRLKVQYEAWSGSRITRKLRRHPDIVGVHLGQDWVPRICPAASGSYVAPKDWAQRRTASLTLLSQAVDEFANIITCDATTELERVVELRRRGDYNEVAKILDKYQEDSPRWKALSTDIKARVLRTKAAIVLDRDYNHARAKELLDAALGLNPQDDQVRLRALIAFYADSVDSALALLVDACDDETVNLRAALLLEAEKADAVIALLSDRGDSGTDAEALRLLALAFLLKKDVSKARLYAEKASELRPEWTSTRLALAIIDYWSGVADYAVPANALSWPQPVDWTHVKQDSDSDRRREHATLVFGELSRQPHLDGVRKTAFELWQLASVAIDPRKRTQAQELCQKLLDHAPTNFGAIAWLLARSLDVDMRLSQQQLSSKLKRAPEPADVLSLAAIHVARGAPKTALSVLKRYAEVFRSPDEQVALLCWNAQVLLTSNRKLNALELLAKSDVKHPAIAELRLLALQDSRLSPASVDEMLSELDKLYNETRSRLRLIDGCRFAAQHGRWNYIVSHATILDTLGTPESIRLLAMAYMQSNMPERAMKEITQHRQLFRDERLPADLARTRILCLKSLGYITQAIDEAEANAREDPSVNNLQIVFETYLAKGDSNGAAAVAVRLIRHADTRPSELIRIARAVRLSHSDIAREALLKAIAIGLPDDAVGTALSLAFELGLRNAALALTQRLSSLAASKKGGVSTATLDQIKDIVQERSQYLQKLDDLYKHGAVPVHLIAANANIPLAQLYHARLVDNENIAATAPPIVGLLARHGGRILPEEFTVSDETRLHADITSILLAEQFALLDLIERCFAPIKIPKAVPYALLAMEDAVAPSQPSRIEALRAILNATTSGHLSTFEPLPEADSAAFAGSAGTHWRATCNRAIASGGFCLAFLPLRNIDNAEHFSPPTQMGPRIINCRSIADALVADGHMSVADYEMALGELGTEGVKHTEVVPPVGASIFCYANTISVLAEAGLLELAARVFQISVSRHYLQEAEREVASSARASELVQWLQGLRHRISSGLDSGRYEFIQGETLPADGTASTPLEQRPEVQCLDELLRFIPTPTDLLWCDDRHVSAYMRRDTVPIAPTLELLGIMRKKGCVDDAQYFATLNRMRQSGVWFLQLTAEEVGYFLTRASVYQNIVAETAELRNIRRYVAATLLHGDILQRAPMPQGSPNEFGEVGYLVKLSRAVCDSIVAQWSHAGATPYEKNVRCNWIFENLYLNYQTALALAHIPTPGSKPELLDAVNLVSLLTSAIGLPSGERNSSRRDYLSWVYERVVRRRFDADLGIRLVAIDQLKRILRNSGELHQSADVADVQHLILQEFYRDLPESIQEELHTDAAFMEYLGFRRIKLADLRGVRFDAEVLWRTCEVAWQSGTAELRSLDGAHIATIAKAEESKVRVSVDGGEPFVLNHEAMPLLDAAVSVRESLLINHPEWFDCNTDERGSLISEIATTVDIWDRLQRLDAAKELSGTLFYKAVAENMRSRGEVNLSHLFPNSVTALLRHYRLSQSVGNRTFDAIYDECAQQLVEDEGAAESFTRLSGLPKALSPVLLERIRLLPAAEADDFLDGICKSARSPVQIIQAAKLAMFFREGKAGSEEFVREAAERLFPQGKGDTLPAFRALLGWVSAECKSRNSAWRLDRDILGALIWLHASRLYSLLAEAGAPNEWINETFTDKTKESPDTWDILSKTAPDMADATQFDSISFLFSSLAYVVDIAKIETVDLELRKKCSVVAFPWPEHPGLPAVSLFRDWSTTTNHLNVFLGGSDISAAIAIAESVDPKERQTPDYDSLAKRAFEKAGAGDVADAWIEMSAIFRSCPVPPKFSQRVAEILANVDLEKIFSTNRDHGFMALIFCTTQIRYLGNRDVASKLRGKLISLAEQLASKARGETLTEKSADLARLLLDPALHTALAIASEDPFDEFAGLMRDMTTKCALLIPQLRRTLRQLIDELPNAKTQKLEQLLVELRASPL